MFFGSMTARCLIVLLLLAMTLPASAKQGSGTVRLDSLIYTNPEPAPPYPFEDRRDSLRAEFEAECDSARATATESPGWLPECHWPTYFYEPPFDARLADVAGGWTEAQATFERELPPDFLAFVMVDVAWDGSVQEARLRVYRGDSSSVDIVDLVRRLRFDLSGHVGFPTLERASFGVPLRGRAADERR
jgi:hypothetical protein